MKIRNFTGFAHSGCPGCPIEGNIENEPQADKIKETASQSAVILLKTKFAGGELNQECNVSLVSVSNFKNQVQTYFMYSYLSFLAFSKSKLQLSYKSN